MAYDELQFESTYEKKKSGKKKWIVLFLLLLLIAAAGVFVISGGLTLIFPGLAHGSGSSPLGGGLVIDPNAGDYVAPEAPKQEQGVAIPGWGSMTIPANTQVLDMVDFHNPIANDGLYYLTFKFCLLNANGEISEVLWESQAVPPGKHIQKITMSRGLPAGTYDAVVHVQPYRMSDQSPTNSANMRTTLIVK
ncbi:MAG: hypothetical protein IIX51_07190 [Methanocorpusculum sp.]|nr:hypothetical protein [Methanocorpusculum sp.]